ncbi:MAG: ROK family protein [Abitibacteriaceae bacterium]|nr:ROK family protein [Abditibacteriaceae bacterium]MBV9864168.1 ROK family protein [Abditibacteriaceae bacterium]
MILGIDISNHDVAVILAQPNGQAELALRSALPRESGSPAIWLAAMETARETLRRAQIEPTNIARVGLAFDAPLNEQGVVLKGARTIGWEGFDLLYALRQHLCVTEAIAESRVICEALGEWQFGALRSTSTINAEPSPTNANTANWLFIHIGTTLAGVACVNGQLLRGTNRAAGEIGAICIERDGALCASGRRGCLEGYCSGDSFVSRAAGYGITLKSVREIWDLSNTNFAARSLCDDYVQRLAQGVGSALAILNPQRLVLGGEIAQELGDKLLMPFRSRLKEFCLPVHCTDLQILPSQLGNDAAAMGAVALAMQRS